jgi:hypothetical protein
LFIRSTPKSTSGGKGTAVHFKVSLVGNDNGYNVTYDCLIKVEHQTSTETLQYQKSTKLGNDDYSTLVAKNGPPSRCPKARRLLREREAAAAIEKAEEPQTYSAAYGGGSSGGANPGTVPTEGSQWPDGWYADPYASESGALWRWYEGGVWTSYSTW